MVLLSLKQIKANYRQLIIPRGPGLRGIFIFGLYVPANTSKQFLSPAATRRFDHSLLKTTGRQTIGLYGTFDNGRFVVTV
jgi:hypothetical protein